MSEEASGNPGAAAWPEAGAAAAAVRRMQTKLHAWAGADRSRRFDDLFNLVCDRAFLVHAWSVVASNAGARTPGVDRATVAWIEAGGCWSRPPGTTRSRYGPRARPWRPAAPHSHPPSVPAMRPPTSACTTA